MIGSSNAIGLRLARLVTLTAAILLLCLGSSAGAAQLHEYTGSDLGPDGIGGSESFESVQGIAVDPGNEDVFVYDSAAGRIYKFDSTGAPADFSALGQNYIGGLEKAAGGGAFRQIAVAPPGALGGTAGDIYLTYGAGVLIFGPDGEELGELKGSDEGIFTSGVAVDPTGRLFIGQFPAMVTEYVPSANPPVESDQTAESSRVFFEGLGNVAVDGAGHLYGAHYAGRIETERPGGEKVFVGGIEKMDSIHATSAKIVDLDAVNLTVDPSTDDLYANRKNEIIQYNSTGKRLGSFGEGVIEESFAVATTPFGATVYVGTPTKVKIFGPKLDLPEVEVEAATDVTTTGALLHGWIETVGGLDATCQFEYVLESSYRKNEASEPFAGASSAPCEPAGPFVGSGQQDVSAQLEGLTPRRTYFFRLEGTNSIGSNVSETGSFNTLPVPLSPPDVSGPCANEALRAGPGLRLPDCRAYELASPTDKWGSIVEPYESYLQAAADGSAVTWFSGGAASGIPSPGDGAHQDPAFYLSSLTGGNWSSQRLLPSEADGERGHFAGATADGRYALLEASNRAGGESALYLLDTANQQTTAIVPPQTVGNLENRVFAFDGASADDSLFFFESELQLTSNAAAGKTNLYVWERETGELSVAGILPGAKSESPPGGSFGGAYSWSSLSLKGVSLERGGAAGALYVGALHAISESGDRVYFTAGKTGQLYLRSGFTGLKANTLWISSANSGVIDPNGQRPAAFQEATPSGDFAFFISSGKLASNSNTGPTDQGSDLYRYGAAAKTLVDVTPLAGGDGARVLGLLGASRDGKSGYLAAKGVLAAGGIEGKINLYHFEEGPAGSFTYEFVVALPSGLTEERNWSPTVEVPKTARVSVDGTTLLFMSSAQQTEESRGKCKYGYCGQVYRYSVGDAAPACLSCNTNTEVGTPIIGAELSTGAGPTLVPENWPLFGVLQRNLSSDGTRVFFQTSESLLPEDVNGQNCSSPLNCVDVYEWEAAGAPNGSCQVAEVKGGCLYLLSSGETENSSNFIDASADGDTAFFTSKSPLVPVDEDQLDDVYAARIDGGIAAQHARPSQPCASAEACNGAAATPAPAGSPGTATFQGPGNEKAKPTKSCKKGFVRKHGKCVKKKAKRKEQKRTTGSKHNGGAK